jgi:hypothetical protein
MKEVCGTVAERVALGEPLGDAAEHAATCARCRRVVALPIELGASHGEADPGIGFPARVTAGAQKRIVVRRRRRIAATLAAGIAATTLGVVFLTRDGAPVGEQTAQTPAPATETHQKKGSDDVPAPTADEDQENLKFLVKMARADRNAHASARWNRIEKPLAPYKHLVKGMTP